MSALDETLAQLHALARPAELAGMARFGMNVEQRLGASIPSLRRLGRQLGRDHALALALWDTGIADARILAALVSEPLKFDSRTMETWVRGFDSWDVCDQVCGNAFVRAPLAWRKVEAWAPRQAEFVRRAAFALLAQLAVHDKAAPDDRFIAALPLIEAASDDDRNFVRKAVNWALRQIGKRDAALRTPAIACAERIRARGSRAARWIAADALRELAVTR